MNFIVGVILIKPIIVDILSYTKPLLTLLSVTLGNVNTNIRLQQPF